jgi:hypothetical protein
MLEEQAREEEEVSIMSLLRQGKAQVLTIYLGESDQWQRTPLYVAIVQFLSYCAILHRFLIRRGASVAALPVSRSMKRGTQTCNCMRLCCSVRLLP